MNGKPTLGDASKTKTGIWGAVTATLGMIGLWIPVLTQGAPITTELITETMGVVTLWLTLIAARHAILKLQS